MSPRSYEPVDTPRAHNFMEKLGANNADFGARTITMASGIILLINNITGPGVPGLPNMFAEAGWLPPVICILVIWLMTTVSSCMYAEAMAAIPGNEGFKGRIEYSSIVQYYFGRNWYIAAQIGLNGALQSLNIISVIQSAQVMDTAISALFKKSCGLNITPFQNTLTDNDGVGHPVAGSTDFFSCIDTVDLDNGHPWGCHVVLSLGFVLTAAMAIPCGRWNLDDNMIVQRVAFVLTIICWLVWIIAVLASTDHAVGVPAINTNPDTGSIAGVLGNVLFNFGFVTTVPSWINEKKPSVSVNKSLWGATTLCIIIYVIIGIPGAYVFSDVLQGPVTGTCQRNVDDSTFNCPNDLMQVMTNPSTAPWGDNHAATIMLQTSVYMFPIVAVVSSIPVFSIVIKYNLVENGMSERAGFLWGVVFPWLTAFPLLYMPDILAQFVNFTSLVFVSFTDFIVPFALYYKLQNRGKNKHTEINQDALHEAMYNDDADREIGAVVDAMDDSEEPFAPHQALSDECGGANPAFKKGLAVVLGVALAALSLTGIILTIQQGSYQFDAQTCALVGS